MRALVPQTVVEALERGATIVTANERAARSARHTWDELQRSRGLTSWETARALSWRSWLSSVWHTLQVNGVSDRMLLSAEQEQRIWRAVLGPEVEPQGGRRLDALASLCADAYGRLMDFSGAEQLQRMRGTLRGDAAAFASWVRRFEQHCQQQRMLPLRALPAAISQLIRPEMLPRTDGEIVLLGFDELLPAQQEMVRTWRARGGEVSVLPVPAATVGTLVRAQDQRAELRGFARWAAARLVDDPESRIALVVADMAGEREEIESVLREVLSPELEDIERDATTAPFEFSLGRSLASEPLIRGALDMLEWMGGAIALERMERLLLGPCFAGHREERAARGRFVRSVYREIRLRPEVTIEQVVRLLDQQPEAGHELAGLRRGLRGLRRAVGMAESGEQQSFGSWTEQIGAVLVETRGAQGLSSRGYQVMERWNGVLDTLSTFDFAGDAVSWAEVLASLKHLVEETTFAPERREAAVQVLGPREAAGSRFDALWLLRCGEMQWPPAQGGHLLLPHTLERSLGMPGGDREAARRGSLLLTQRLASSAAEVWFSYAEGGSEGTMQRPAVEVLAMHPVRRTLEEVVPAERTHAVVSLERLADTGQIAPLRDRTLRGGVRVLELQAQCGFLAFSELRLQARELEAENFGLSAGERGSAVHLALETLWDRLKAQQALLELSASERWAVLDEAITAGLGRASRAVEGAWERSYLDVQRERMRRLLGAWLEQEMKRPAFVVDQQEEKVQALQVGPLCLSVRVDRVDLVDGARVLLDYKTGAAHTTQWKGERPDRPQVPLYAVLASTSADASGAPEVAPLGAVAFAKVVPGGEMGLQGFEREDLNLLPRGGRSGMEAPSFDAQVRRWSEIVARLATEFADGDARVRPKQFPGSCAHCGHRILCRVDAADFEAVSTDEDDAERDE